MMNNQDEKCLHSRLECANLLFRENMPKSNKEPHHMEIVKTIFVCIQLLLCASLICVIVLQSGKNSGLSAFTGANESYLAKNKAKSRDARLALATKWVAGIVVVLTVVLNLI